MKRFKYLFLGLALLAFSCTKESSNDTPADYSKLGVESITINNTTINVEGNGVLLDVKSNKNISVIGTSNANKKETIEYVYLLACDAAPTVTAKSKYSDTRIVVTNSVVSGKNICTLVISRADCSEELTYIFSFIKIG